MTLSQPGSTDLVGVWEVRVHQKGLLSWENVDVQRQLPPTIGRHFLCGQYRALSTAMTPPSTITV